MTKHKQHKAFKRITEHILMRHIKEEELEENCVEEEEEGEE